MKKLLRIFHFGILTLALTVPNTLCVAQETPREELQTIMAQLTPTQLEELKKRTREVEEKYKVQHEAANENTVSLTRKRSLVMLELAQFNSKYPPTRTDKEKAALEAKQQGFAKKMNDIDQFKKQNSTQISEIEKQREEFILKTAKEILEESKTGKTAAPAKPTKKKIKAG